jgi:hypothetical protein
VEFPPPDAGSDQGSGRRTPSRSGSTTKRRAPSAPPSRAPSRSPKPAGSWTPRRVPAPGPGADREAEASHGEGDRQEQRGGKLPCGMVEQGRVRPLQPGGVLVGQRLVGAHLGANLKQVRGGIRLSGSRPVASSSRGCRASSRSVLACRSSIAGVLPSGCSVRRAPSDCQIRRLVISIDLVGSRRIWAAHMGWSSIQTDPDRSRWIDWMIKHHPTLNWMAHPAGRRPRPVMYGPWRDLACTGTRPPRQPRRHDQTEAEAVQETDRRSRPLTYAIVRRFRVSTSRDSP